MNTKNNKRKRDSKIKLENAFIELLIEREVKNISVKDICERAQLNRSTFYANYLDIYDLIDKLNDRFLHDFEELYAFERLNKYNSNDFSKLFQHIYENQLLYKTYFKLQSNLSAKITRYDTNYAEKYYKSEHIEYHLAFFKAGMTAIIQMWLDDGCKFSPEELSQIVKSEYMGKPDY